MIGELQPDVFSRRFTRARPALAALLALALHGRIEAGGVYFEAATAQDVLGEIERKPERVVQFERGFAFEFLAFLQARQFVFQKLEAVA